MKCPKCKRGKLKFKTHTLRGMLRSIYKCTSCHKQLSMPGKWETGDMVCMHGMDVEKEMIDIISKQIMKDHAEAVGKAIDSIADELCGKSTDEIPVIELEMETSYIGKKNGNS